MYQKGTFLGQVFISWTQRSLLVLFMGLFSWQSALADKVILLSKDTEALQARVDLIQQAQSEIIAEYFSVWNDDESLGAISLLLNAAQKGVKVRVIVDALSNSIPNSVFALLEKYGKDKNGNQTFEVKVYNPIGLNPLSATHRDHAKMLVADGQRLISGGRNVGDKYFGLNKTRNFDDLDIFAEGEVAREARANFMEVWNSDVVYKAPLHQFSEDKIGPQGCVSETDQQHCEFIRQAAIKQLAIDNQRMINVLKQIQTKEDDDYVTSDNNRDWFLNRRDSVDAEFMSHDPRVLNSPGHDELSRRLIQILKNAQSDVDIVSPYLIPPQELMNTFADLIKRKIRVRIITNSLRSTDNLFAQSGYRTFRQKLIKMGLEIYEYNGPDTIHAKTAVIDHKIAIVGTFNLDPRSAYLNREVAIKMTDADGDKLVTELTETIDNFRQEATLVAKDGIEYNQDKEFRDVSKTKKVILKLLNFIMPVIKHQL